MNCSQSALVARSEIGGRRKDHEKAVSSYREMVSDPRRGTGARGLLEWCDSSAIESSYRVWRHDIEARQGGHPARERDDPTERRSGPGQEGARGGSVDLGHN